MRGWGWLIVVCGCGRIDFDPFARATMDGQGSDQNDVAAAACDPTKPFASPQPIASLVSGNLDGTLRLSPDELHGVFWSTRSTPDADIYNADRPDLATPFTVTANPALNSSGNDYEGTLTENGLGLVFRSDRAGGAGGSDLYTATRANVAIDWTGVSPVSSVNTTAEEIQPYLPPGRSELYYTSGAAGRPVIYRAVRNSSLSFSSGVAVPELDDGISNTRDPVATADGHRIYFGSDRPGGMGGFDVWVAARSTSTVPFGVPELVPELSTSADEGPNYISVDGCRMYLSSTISGTVVLYFSARP